MLADISWGAYLTTVTVILGLWYGYLVIRYHGHKLKDALNGRSRSGLLTKEIENEAEPFAEFNEPFDTLQDAEMLHRKIISVFEESAARGISRTEFLNYLRFVLDDFPFVRQSALRSKIKSLTVLESRKYPDFQLDAAETDSLWDSEE